MTTTVVRFDEELGYVHAADGLRCPRGVVHSTPTGWNGSSGSYREVQPCSLNIGHDGDCVGAARLTPANHCLRAAYARLAVDRRARERPAMPVVFRH